MPKINFSEIPETPESNPKSANRSKEDYQQQLKDERWFRLRQRILQRDTECRHCTENASKEVHHLWYQWPRKAWEYPNEALIGLCSKCHDAWHSSHETGTYPEQSDLGVGYLFNGDAEYNSEDPDFVVPILGLECSTVHLKTVVNVLKAVGIFLQEMSTAKELTPQQLFKAGVLWVAVVNAGSFDPEATKTE